jgi:uncharacterized protein (TIGR02118 family)
MTVKLVVMYTKPDDPEAFDEHYFATHMPLARKIPGLERAETGRIVAAADGQEVTYYRIVSLYFGDRAALDSGLATDEALATSNDFKQIAPPGSRMFVEHLDD